MLTIIRFFKRPPALLISGTLALNLTMALGISSHVHAAPKGLFAIYQQAKLQDPVLASAGHANQAAQELIEQAKANYRPSVLLSANANANQTQLKLTGNNVFLPDGNNRFEGYAAKIEARQPIYRKENLERIDLSRVQVTIADKQYHLAQQALMLRTTQAYFAVLQAQDQLTLLAAQQAAILRQLAQAKATFEAGTATITDVHEAQARHDLIAAQSIAAHNGLEIAKRSLEAIIGPAPHALASLRQTMRLQTQLETLEVWQTTAQTHNLNLQIQQDVVELNTRNIQIAQAGHYPNVDAVASYTDSYFNGSQNGFGSQLQNAVIGVEVSVPLYLGGAVDSRVRQASYHRQQAMDDLQNTTRQTALETQRAYLNLTTNVAQIQALEQALNSSQSQLDATQLGYQVGVRTSVDILNAQQQFYSAKRDLLQARYQYVVNLIQLKTVSGIVSDLDIQDIDQQLDMVP